MQCPDTSNDANPLSMVKKTSSSWFEERKALVVLNLDDLGSLSRGRP